MATARRFSATQPFAVQQAQLIDPGAFRLDTQSAEALAVAGELLKRREEAIDSLGIADSKAAIKNAELTMEQELINTPFDQRAAVRLKHINQTKSDIGLLKMSGKARGSVNNDVDIWGEGIELQGEIVDTKAIADEALVRTGDVYGEAIVTAEGNLEDPNVIEAEAEFDKMLANLDPADAMKIKDGINETSVKQIEDNAIQFQKNKAVVSPQQIQQAVTDELEARKKGKKPSGEFGMLDNTALEGIRDYANTIGEKQKTQSELNLNASVVDAYGQIRDGEVDIDSLIDKNNLDPNQSNEDKIKFAEKIPTYFNKINSTDKAAITSNEDVYDELTRSSEAVERGALSPAAFEEEFAGKKGQLTVEDQRTIRSKDIVATKTMQNRAFSDAISATQPILVELAEGDLAALKLARDNAELIKDIPTINLFNIATKKNQAERWNMGRFRQELRSQIAQNPEWSQKQIFTAQQVLADNLDLPVGELLKAFDAQNPNSAILKEPPDISFKDIWPNLELDDKAKIWELRMRGAPARAIIGELSFRPSGQPKGRGFLGELQLSGGGVATEFSIGTTDVTGAEINIPTLVPTLSKSEIELLVTDIIPNNKPVPKEIAKKAIAHAKKRVREGKSVFLEEGE